MKSIICLVFISSYLTSFAQQKFKAGFSAGLAASQVHGDTYSGFDKAGYLVGGFVKRAFNETIEGKFEINLLQKGSRKNQNAEKGDYKYYLLRLNYVEVPLLLRAHQKKWIFEMGGAFATLIKAREYNELGEVIKMRPFKKTDTSFLLGLSYTMNEKIEINARYINSIFTVRKFDNGANFEYNNWFYNLFNRGYYNNVLTFALNYQI